MAYSDFDTALTEASIIETELVSIEKLQQEVLELRIYKHAFEAQALIVHDLVSMYQVSTGRILLKTMLRRGSQLMTQLTGAEECSWFLFSADGKVSESLLARGATLQEDKDSLIGKVLDTGLAGWVFRQKKPGVIVDTRMDERWVNLPYQPYQAGSALCVPLTRGNSMVGMITLTHSEPNHFTPTIARTLELCSVPLALIFYQAKVKVDSQLK
ncbi:MAG: GAF domain-containing protein [Cyanobacteria bacterium P01_H01_bin.15]